MHALRRRREQGAAAALTVRPVLPSAEARRRSMAAHPSAAHRLGPLAPVVRLPVRGADGR